MRSAFARTLVELARLDENLYLVVGDVGFGVFEQFAAEFPKRYINVGVAEGNLAGVSAGLALAGKIPFMYSIANFPTLRCLEQIRNDICYAGSSVKIVSVGGGLAYGSLGASHHATEDIAIMRALPAMTVVCPADPVEAALATRAARSTRGPFYLRLNRAGDPIIHHTEPIFEVGRAIRVRDGTDVTLIGSGAVVHVLLEAAQMLDRQAISSRVLSMHTVKPIDTDAVLSAAQATGCIVTVEEHSRVGGLGSAVADILMDEQRTDTRFARIALPDAFPHLVGSQDYLRRRHGITAEAVVGRVLSLLRPTRPPIAAGSTPVHAG